MQWDYMKPAEKARSRPICQQTEETPRWGNFLEDQAEWCERVHVLAEQGSRRDLHKITREDQWNTIVAIVPEKIIWPKNHSDYLSSTPLKYHQRSSSFSSTASSLPRASRYANTLRPGAQRGIGALHVLVIAAVQKSRLQLLAELLRHIPIARGDVKPRSKKKSHSNIKPFTILVYMYIYLSIYICVCVFIATHIYIYLVYIYIWYWQTSRSLMSLYVIIKIEMIFV